MSKFNLELEEYNNFDWSSYVSYYEDLIKGLSDHQSPEEGHFFERSWAAVFHPLKETYIIKYNKL